MRWIAYSAYSVNSSRDAAHMQPSESTWVALKGSFVTQEDAVQAQQMISTHPDVRGSTNDALIRCIEECYSCAQTCTSCADACLAEPKVQELTQCIRLNLDCADICSVTGRISTRRTGSDEEVIRRMLDVCAAACRLCGDECKRHASTHEHCRICADACRRCMQACEEAGRSMAH